MKFENITLQWLKDKLNSDSFEKISASDARSYLTWCIYKLSDIREKSVLLGSVKSSDIYKMLY